MTRVNIPTLTHLVALGQLVVLRAGCVGLDTSGGCYPYRCETAMFTALNRIPARSSTIKEPKKATWSPFEGGG
jgi:hypothetical protein